MKSRKSYASIYSLLAMVVCLLIPHLIHAQEDSHEHFRISEVKTEPAANEAQAGLMKMQNDTGKVIRLNELGKHFIYLSKDTKTINLKRPFNILNNG